MKVQDIMTGNPKACKPDTSLAEAAHMMWEQDCGVLPVTNDAGKLAGVITDRDICFALVTQNKLASEIRIGDVMEESVQACSPDDDIADALEIMRENKVRRLPVTEHDNSLQGILSLNDIVLQAEKGSKKRGISYEDAMLTLKAVSSHRETPKSQTART